MIRRDSKLHKEWITKVLQRDLYRCRWCHVTDNLVAHHIKSWEEYPELRVDLENGMTLCKACHMRHHKNHKGHKQIPWNKGKKTGVGGPKGHKFTEEHRLKLRLMKINKSSWNKGIPMREDTKIKQSLLHKGKTWIIDPVTNKRIWINKNRSDQNVDK